MDDDRDARGGQEPKKKWRKKGHLLVLRLGQAGGKEFAEEGFERGVGSDELVVSIRVVCFVADVFQKLVERGVVFVGDEVRLDHECGVVFKIDEAVGAIEVETDFLRIHEVEKGDVVFPVAQVLQGIGKRRGVGEEIREDDDEGALADFFRDDMERIDEAGFAGGLDFFDGGEKSFKVSGAA